MSRTIRKNRWHEKHTDVSYVNREMEYYTRHGFKTHVKRRRSKEDIRRDIEAVEERYQKAIADNGGTDFLGYSYSPWSCTRREKRIYREYVPRYTRVEVSLTREDIEKKALKERSRMTRDGYWNETTANSGFKNEAKKAVRRANKRFCQMIESDDLRWEDEPYPHDHLGDGFRWNWW